MTKEQACNNLEWTMNVPDGTSEKLEPETAGVLSKTWSGLKGFVRGIVSKIWRLLHNAWSIGVADPRKAIHGFKVGLAVSIVSLLYYMRPLYDDFGGAAMWAVMTVVLVFEYTVGATLSKCINRVIGTLTAAALGVGIHWVAEQSGDQFKPFIIAISVFLFASAATFSRFIPSIKSRFDYGAMIFILTFSFVTVSGYRVVELFELAHQRMATIAIGTSSCIVVTMLFSPVWAGCELHNLIHKNMEKLADSLDGCVSEYFKENRGDEDLNNKKLGYKCALNSKAAEEVMANFARWEPKHGRFNFRHPWKQYLKIGASLRKCAYCIETLNSCIGSEIQAPQYLKKHFSDKCTKASSYSTNVLKELALTIAKMKKSTTIDLKVAEMNFAVQELQDALKSLPMNFAVQELQDALKSLPTNLITEGSNEAAVVGKSCVHASPVTKVLPLVTLVSLLAELAARVGGVADAVEELASIAKFKPENDGKSKRNTTNELVSDNLNGRTNQLKEQALEV